jgi:glycosyltransferase involved in cell wall biosynthesis
MPAAGESPRIAFAAPAWPPGRAQNGIVTYVEHMRAGLLARGVPSAVLASDCGPTDDPLVAAAVHGRDLPLAGRIRRALARRLADDGGVSFGIADGLARAARTLSRTWPFDAIEVEESFGIAAELPRRTPVIVRLHGPWFLTGGASGAADDAAFRTRVAREWRGMQRAVAVSAPSQTLLDAVCARYGALPPRATVVPNPGPPLPAQAWAPTGSQRLLHVGRFERLKGSDLVLDAFAAIAARFPAAELTVVGPDLGMRMPDGHKASFAEFVAARGYPATVAARIRFLGPQPPDEVAALRRASALCVVASRYENFPMTVLEAMADGCPLVATAVGGIPEMLRDGDTARLVAPDAAALATAFAALLADPAAAAACGARARADYARRFTPAAVAERMLAFYREVL